VESKRAFAAELISQYLPDETGYAQERERRLVEDR
jgi:hypothetical protein